MKAEADAPRPSSPHQQSNLPPAARLPGLDGLKGLSILCVVLIHAAPDPGISPAYEDHVVGGAARLAVPCFLLVSGYLAGLRNTPRERLAAYFWRYLRFHLIYGFFYWGVALVQVGPAPEWTLKGTLLHFGEAAYAGQFYFVVLVQTYLVTGLLLPPAWWRSRAMLGLAALGALAGLLIANTPAVQATLADLSWAGKLVRNPSGLWHWFFYFVLGALLGARERGAAAGKRRPGSGIALLLAATACAVAALGIGGPLDRADLLVYPYARLRVVVGAMLLAPALPTLARLSFGRPLTRLGRESFGIFVFNPAALVLLRGLLGPPQSPAESWLLWALGVTLAYATTLAARRWAPALVP